MTEVNLGPAADIADPGRKLVDIEGVEIAVFHFKGKFTAFENVCPHLAGPACAGIMLPLATEAVDPDGTSRGRMFDHDHLNVVCPWHGYEFDVTTGQHATLKRVRLRPIKLRVEGGEVWVTLPPNREANVAASYQGDGSMLQG
jgi:nitrite reductase/ring-hydroxylating ferredoxin subunit